VTQPYEAQKVIDSATEQALIEKAQSKFQTLDRFVWPGGDHPKPETNQNHIRLYSHNLCPFVCRARWALAAKDLPF